MPSDPAIQILLDAARAEVATMRQAIAALAPGGTITMSRDQFATLAGLLDRLAQDRGCGDSDCFHAPVDGIRWWVPHGEITRAQTDLTQLRAENQRLCAELFRSAAYR